MSRRIRLLSNLIIWLFMILAFVSCQESAPNQSEDALYKKSVITDTYSLDNLNCIEGIQSSGALFKICVPEGWNRQLVLFAHGYVSPTEALAIPELMLDDTTSMAEMVTGYGYAFATTSYSKNGLAIKEGIDDLADLVDIFENNYGRTNEVFLIGASEGGLISTLSMEKKFFLYSGALSLCGPNGDFQEQINYFGNFRVIFDHYFPDVLPGTAVEIPQELMDNFESVYVPAILKAVESDQVSAALVLKISKVAIDKHDPIKSALNSIISLLWYNVFSTNDAIKVLGGQPFDNSEKVYKGGFGMRQINASVPRYEADVSASNEIQSFYQTSGQLFKPMIMVHNYSDPIIPRSQQDMYVEKVSNAGSMEFLVAKTAFRNGHCNFTANEMGAAFLALIYQVNGEFPVAVDKDLKYRILRQLQ